MKIVSFFIIILFPVLSFCQNFVDAEVDALAEQIATRLDGKNNLLSKSKKYAVILVEDFVDTEGNVSKLGASLAEEFTLALSSAGVSFSVTGTKDLANDTQTRNSRFSLGDIVQGAEKIIDGATDDNYSANNEYRDKLNAADGIVDIERSISLNRSAYKGIDAVVAGTLTESNDQYRLLIKVISTRKGNEMVTNAKGFITKTPFILALEEEENLRRQNGAGNENLPNRIPSTTRGKRQQVVTINSTEVELLEVKQVGQNIECDFRITNKGADVEFYIYGQNSGGKLIDSNNSYDYWASQVQLGELMRNGEVRKTLVTDNPVEAKVTFGGVARDVSRIAKLSVKCYGHGGYFWIEFRDVNVN